MTPSNRICVLAIAFCLCLPAAAFPADAVREKSAVRSWLEQMVQRLESSRDEALRNEYKAGATLRKAEALLSRAKAAGSVPAEAAAGKAADNAREAQRKAGSQRMRAESTLSYLKPLLERQDRYAIGAAFMGVHGKVEIRNGDQWLPMGEDKRFLPPGTTVRTGPDSGVGMELPDGSRAWLGPDSRFTVAQPPEGWGEVGQLLNIEAGVVKAHVMKGIVRKFEVRGTCGGGAVRGTSFRVRQAEGGSTVFEVDEGVVEVADLKGDGKVSVTAGFRVEVRPGGLPGKAEPFTPSNGPEPWEVPEGE